MISKDETHRFWSGQAKRFLENKIEFRMPPVGWQQPDLKEVRPEEAIGQPIHTLTCTDMNGQIMYLCEWPNGSRKLIPTSAVDDVVVLPFLENFVLIVGDDNLETTDIRGRQSMNYFIKNGIWHVFSLLFIKVLVPIIIIFSLL